MEKLLSVILENGRAPMILIIGLFIIILVREEVANINGSLEEIKKELQNIQLELVKHDAEIANLKNRVRR